jgi:transketolase
MKYYINKYDLFIFDLNNAIVNVEEYHYKAWINTLKELVGSHFTFSFNYFCEKFHPKDSESIKLYLEKLNLYDYETIMKTKNEKYLEILEENKNNIKLIDGFEKLLKIIIDNNKHFIIISDTFKDNIDFLVELFPILKKAYMMYYREIFNKKLNSECYNNIYQKYYTEFKHIIYFTYYIIVIDSLYEKDINLVYINSLEYDIYYSIIKEKYKNILCIKNYNELDEFYFENKIINTLRLLCIDMISEANSGHPGTPLGIAPTMYILWCKIMRFNPKNPLLYDRDRFVLSNGHACTILYSILHLLGYNYSIDDLKNFRKINSITSGHPEYDPNLGIEVSTGVLGQGIANAVGMAIASKKLNLNNKVYVICGDGDLMEGISYESASLAGHLELNNLILLYDSNNITIDGFTNITFTENIKKRFKSQNWNVLEVNDGDHDINDIYNKILLASKSINQPTLIIIKTTIGYGCLNSGSNTCHGTPLNKEKVILLKQFFNFDITKKFFIDDDIKLYFDNLIKEKSKISERNIINTKNNNNNLEYELDLLKSNKKSYATRDISLFCLNIINKNINNVIIGSADLGESTKTLIKSSFISKNNFEGNYIHFGVREHSMAGIANGISTYNLIPIVSTFLIFMNYCLPSIRLSALSLHHVIYILSHDSVLIGEDGPTHQPIESLTILRSIPNLLVFRPCDIDEVVEVYKYALKYNGPSTIILSRQVLPYIYTNNIKDINKGCYIIYEPLNNIDYIIIATGSEVSLAIEIAKINNKNIRVVSMVSTSLYDKQSNEYKNKILPKNIIKISIEAGSTLGWYKYADYVIGIDSFGKSGSIDDIRSYFGLNVENINNYINNI